MAKVIKASGNEVESYWPALFAKALKGQNIEELLSNIASAPVPVAGGAPAPVAAAAGAKAPGKISSSCWPLKFIIIVEEKKKEEEADVDMGGLFGDDYWVHKASPVLGVCR